MRRRAAAYVPERGDLVWLNFSPQAGHEQAGRRPALVLSLRPYNRVTGLAIACPVTSRSKGYPFEVAVKSVGIEGVVLCDQLKSIDWRERRAQFADRATSETIAEVIARLRPLLGL
ncbi:MAG TPA: endoribonuclease MazF [Candidatus Binataceae bacterium]|nr:endoribonuclease MazF [Candidatus Binataceae bacterium]